MDRMPNRPRVQGRREMAMQSKHQESQQKAPERKVQRTLSQHSKCVRRNVQHFTRSLSSERMRTSVQKIGEEVQIDVTTMAEEYCYVETRHSEEICISPGQYSTADHCEGRLRSSSSRGEGHSQPRTRVMGRRQMRELKAIQNQSTKWECESVDSGHCSEFSSRSSLSSAASTHSGGSRDTSFSEDEVFVSDSEEMRFTNTTVCAPNVTEYASVMDSPVKKLDNTYASIHTICDTPPVATPPELPPRNRGICKSNKSLRFTQDNVSEQKRMQPTECDNVIVKSRYHKYTVDDIVDSYMSLVNDIPVPAPELRRCHSDNLQRRPVRESPMKRSKSAQHFKPCPQTVTKATSSFAVKYNVSVDSNEIFF